MFGDMYHDISESPVLTIINHRVVTPAAQRAFVAFEYGAGDNSYGAILSRTDGAMVTNIHDGDLENCTVKAETCLLSDERSALRTAPAFARTSTRVITSASQALDTFLRLYRDVTSVAEGLSYALNGDRNLRVGARRGYGRRMRRMSYAVLAIAVTATASHAEEEATPPEPVSEGRPTEKGTLGLGLIFGEPTGISAKLYLEDDQAIQGAIGASFIAYGYHVHAEYVLHPWILQDRDTFVLPVYVGPGLRVIDYAARGQDSHWAVGLRAVGGLLFDFKNVPLDVFVEVAGILEYDFTEGVGLALNVGAGVRYYF